MASPNAAPVAEVSTSAAPRALRFVWPVQGAIVLVVALWALWFQLRLPSKLPTDSDYQAVADVLAREAQPGDVLVVYPWWADRVRTFVPDSLPVVGYLHYENDPLVRHGRIWLLAQPDLPKSDLDGFLKTFGVDRTRVGEARSFGTLQLSAWTNGRARFVTFDAPAIVKSAPAQAIVYLEQADKRRVDCPWNGDRFQCPGGPHLYVRTEWHEVFYQPRQCLWMHPPGGDTRLVVQFTEALAHRPDNAVTTDGVLETGYIWDTAFRTGPGNTTTYVRVDDGEKALADVALTPGLEGMQRATFKADGATGTLRVGVQSAGNDARWICVDLLAFGRQGGVR